MDSFFFFFFSQRSLEIKIQPEGLVFPSVLSLESIAFEVHEAYLKSGPGGAIGKESACQCRWCGFSPWVGKIPWRRKWQLATVFLPRIFHGQRSLAGLQSGSQSLRWLSTRLLASFYLNCDLGGEGSTIRLGQGFLSPVFMAPACTSCDETIQCLAYKKTSMNINLCYSEIIISKFLNSRYNLYKLDIFL